MKVTTNMKEILSTLFTLVLAAALFVFVCGAIKTFYKETRRDNATFAMCVSAKGSYGGGKCFVNGVELKNDSNN